MVLQIQRKLKLFLSHRKFISLSCLVFPLQLFHSLATTSTATWFLGQDQPTRKVDWMYRIGKVTMSDLRIVVPFQPITNPKQKAAIYAFG